MNDRSDSAVHSMPRKYRLDVLSLEEVERVHRDTLTVLEGVGIAVEAEPILGALGEAGARVDRDGKRVFFSGDLVERSLEGIPRDLVFAGRRPGADLHLDGNQGYLTVDGCAAEVIDLDSGERRPSTKKDLELASRLADALPEIGLLWQPVSARDVPRRAQSLHELHGQLANSSKHIQMMTAVTAEAARGVVAIARLVAGGAEELRRRPILSAFQCSLSPLSYEGEALEAARVLAAAGVPCGFVVMPIACASAPATVAGTLVQSNAEILAGIVALQLLVPGAATFYGSCATVMDLRSGAAACGGPEDLFFQMSSAQLARRYGVPSIIGTFATGAKMADWQAGLENGLSGMASCLAGADLMCGAGLVHAARVFSLEQMVLDCETFALLRHLFSASTVTAEDSAVEVIRAVGPGGHFLGEAHTLANMRRQWMPRLLDRASWEDWEASGRSGPREMAAERIRSLLEAHEPEPLDSKLEEEIVGIIEAHERRTGDQSNG
jgi:trimethylamine--corrinoid protein Co-methyltransferase